MAQMRHQAGDERVRLDAESEDRDADVGEDAVETLDEKKPHQDEVAEQRRL